MSPIARKILIIAAIAAVIGIGVPVGLERLVAQLPAMHNKLYQLSSYNIIDVLRQSYGDKVRSLTIGAQVLVAALTAWPLISAKPKIKKQKADIVGKLPSAGYGQYGNARWQTEKEKDKSATVWYTDDKPKKAGLILGMEKQGNREKVWMATDDVHILLIAGTRSGKSRKFYFPMIWSIAQAKESMIVTDPKGELYDGSSDYLRSIGYNVICINIKEPEKGNSWNIIDCVVREINRGNVAKAVEYATNIAYILSGPQGNTDPVWTNGQRAVLSALIILAATAPDPDARHMLTAYNILTTMGCEDENGKIPLTTYMMSLEPLHPARLAFAAATLAPEKMRASFFSTAITSLSLWIDPNVAQMTLKSDHQYEDIVDKPSAVYLVIPDDIKTRHGLAVMYIDQMYQAMVEITDRNGGRLPRRINCLMDEFGNMPAINDYATKITVAGGRGIRFLLALQNLEQLKAVYRDDANTVSSNCHKWIYLATSGADTKEIISKMLGKYTVEVGSSGMSSSDKTSSASVNAGLAARELLTPSEVGQWDKSKSLIIQQGQYPAWYPLQDLSQWRANADFGFVPPSGDEDADKAENNKIIKKRTENAPRRPHKEVKLWLPEVPKSEKQDDTTPKQRKRSAEQSFL